MLQKMIAAQEVAIRPDNSSVIFTLIENPVKIVVENQQIKNIVAKANVGTLRPGMKPGEYFYFTDSCSLMSVQIFVGLKTRKGIKWIDTTSYRVKNATQPVLAVSWKKGGATWKDKLLERPKLELFFEDFFITDIYFRVDTFSVEAYRNDSLIYSEYNVSGNRFSPDLIKFIDNEEPGYSLIFFDIRGSGPGSECWTRFEPVTILIRKPGE
ncbi:MAG TPA: GldM family protein [Bacteroidales bacterium]|nr:GldM family protein [Bacteroidales bacterium]HRZ47834.1 GldM family protein [Bacteroidales bacterium]